MGIQISFDTDGITDGSVEDPRDRVVYSFETVLGREETHDQTEGFQERVEPPITDLEDALGCEPAEDAISLERALHRLARRDVRIRGPERGHGVRRRGEAHAQNPRRA